MAKHWTKIRRDIVGSERMAKLLETNPLAYALYLNAKAVCDDYGRLEGSPRKFKGRTAPMASIPVDDVAQALRDMILCDVINPYVVDGDDYIEIVAYNEIEQTDWRNVGRPDYPPPPGWEPPADLLQLLRESTDGRIKPSRYGLSADLSGQSQRTTIGGPSGDGRATIGRRSSDGRYAREADSEADTDTENGSPDAGAHAREEPTPEFPEDPDPPPCEHPRLLEAIRQAQPTWPLRRQQEFFAGCLQAAEDPNTPVEAEDLVGWLHTDGLKPSHVDRAEGWLRRMLAKRGERERAASRASPRSATVPADRSRFGKGVVG